MTIKSTAFSAAKNAYTSIVRLLPGYVGKRFSAECAEQLVPVDTVNTKYGNISYYCFGKLPLWRSQTLFKKEPETLEWIDNMNKHDTLWDIGANVGLYSIYAGIKGLNVFAFEPSALNTFFISKNIELNNLQDSVVLMPLALSDKAEFGYLNMSNTHLGGAVSEFSSKDLESLKVGNYEKKVVFKQGMFSDSIDRIIEQYKFEIPNYIKIDVDSIEDKIIYGAEKTLANPKLKGLLVELDETENRTKELIDFLTDKGLYLKEKKHAEMFNSGDFTMIYNYIFERK